jgi:hypothetical protein
MWNPWSWASGLELPDTAWKEGHSHKNQIYVERDKEAGKVRDHSTVSSEG